MNTPSVAMPACVTPPRPVPFCAGIDASAVHPVAGSIRYARAVGVQQAFAKSNPPNEYNRPPTARPCASEVAKGWPKPSLHVTAVHVAAGAISGMRTTTANPMAATSTDLGRVVTLGPPSASLSVSRRTPSAVIAAMRPKNVRTPEPRRRGHRPRASRRAGAAGDNHGLPGHDANVDRKRMTSTITALRRKRSLRGVRPSTGARLPGIEGLRAIAACSILVFHVWSLQPVPPTADLGLLDRFMPDLAFGVVLFFTLSGFLLYRPFAAAILRNDRRPGIVSYLRNRALRILPAYWVILLLCTALGSFLVWDSHGRLVTDRVLEADLLARAALFVQDYSPRTLLLGIGPAWSLAVEVVFYLALPLLVLLAAILARRAGTRTGRRWAVLAPPVLLLLAGLTGKAVTHFLVPSRLPYAGYDQNWHSVLERSFLCQADLFAFGMVVAVLRVDWEDELLRLPRWWRPAAAAGAVSAYAFTTDRFRYEQLSYSPANTLMAGAFAALLALVVLEAKGNRPSALVRVLEARPLVALGVISYSIFLWHEPLIRWLREHELLRSGSDGFATNLVLAGSITVVASATTYLLVEAPALRLKFRGQRRKSVPVGQVEAAP
jgi:peptidoglycan/LPS O-acetylase OafA/YrhL